MNSSLLNIVGPLLIYGLCACYFVVVTNHAIDRAQESCRGAVEPNLPRASFRSVGNALWTKSIFLFSLISFMNVLFMSSQKVNGLSWFVMALVSSCLVGGAGGLILGVITGFAAYVGASQKYNWNKSLPLGVLILLMAFGSLLLFV